MGSEPCSHGHNNHAINGVGHLYNPIRSTPLLSPAGTEATASGCGGNPRIQLSLLEFNAVNSDRTGNDADDSEAADKCRSSVRPRQGLILRKANTKGQYMIFRRQLNLRLEEPTTTFCVV